MPLVGAIGDCSAPRSCVATCELQNAGDAGSDDAEKFLLADFQRRRQRHDQADGRSQFLECRLAQFTVSNAKSAAFCTASAVVSPYPLVTALVRLIASVVEANPAHRGFGVGFQDCQTVARIAESGNHLIHAFSQVAAPCPHRPPCPGWRS